MAIVVGLPIGLWLGHTRRGSFVAVTVANVGRAVPSIGLVFLFFAVLGAGFLNIMLALVLLAIPPILTNAYTGVREVEADVVDAARGVGMTGAEIVRRVELPLALPLVAAGIRTSAVNVIATATLGPEGGVVTLGDPIINPTAYGGSGRLGAALLVAILAVAAEVGLGAVERAVTPKGTQSTAAGARGAAPRPAAARQEEGTTDMTIRRARSLRGSLRLLAALALLLLAVAGLAACGSDNNDSSSSSSSLVRRPTAARSSRRNSANGKTTLVVGSKNFTEQKVLGEIYAQALAAAGYKVRKELNLGDEQTALKALKSGTISGYPEYTGTALLSFLGVKAGDLPKTDAAAYDQVKAGMAKQGIVAEPPTPFTDSNEVGGDEGHGRQAAG